jgi:hypothetical protein
VHVPHVRCQLPLLLLNDAVVRHEEYVVVVVRCSLGLWCKAETELEGASEQVAA